MHSSVHNDQGIGVPLRRVEDRRFLTGRGRFVADVELSGALACALVRSPHAHAAIRRIDISAALASSGVVAVLTGADMAADGMAPMRPLWVIRSREGSPMAEPPRFALAREKVRHVGEPVAAVIAETPTQALDAAERVEVGYEPLAALAEPQSEKLTLYTSTQAPHHIRRQVTEQLGISESALRVISPDVGGGFGYKGKLYPEEGILTWAARRLGRPVRWVATRAESFVSDNQARDHLTHAELAFDADGRFLALHV